MVFALQELVDKRRAMMEEYRKYREKAMQMYQDQRTLRLELRGGSKCRDDASYVLNIIDLTLLGLLSVPKSWFSFVLSLKCACL